jgi:hypothetical protein
MTWAKLHFERGLIGTVQRQVAPLFTATDTIDIMATKAQKAYEYHLRWKAEHPRQAPSRGVPKVKSSPPSAAPAPINPVRPVP